MSSIHEQSAASNEGRSFGIFYGCQNVEAQVFDVILTGDWPQEFDEAVSRALFQSKDDEAGSPAERAARDA